MSLDSQPLVSLPLPPATLSSLAKAGYETVDDLLSSTVEDLAKELHVPNDTAQKIFALVEKRNERVPLSQPVSVLASKATGRVVSTTCAPLDHILGGGISRAHVLELSGPPGTVKEDMAIGIVKAFSDLNERTIFVGSALIYVPQPSLLVINSISFPFHSASSLSRQTRNSLLDRIKQALTKACAAHNLTVVTTTQMATKFVGLDGLPANFDAAGSRGVMLPQLGPSYLPDRRTTRVVVAPSSQTSGVLRTLSRPLHQSAALPGPVEYILPSTSRIPCHVDG
ncbi:hypothetical protein PC9H_008715 [Pleurotus ostreatus]|uniref:DNA recombination and repair protein Rad51-like C-terminal domain-containing protein n=1 Tax=Pleurotus ostreatus TaxID=5322 RepID=A0A8H7DQU1_PLEOS|nr:uncharacterized protein PC9H_008715 [Pleurotus ostreatus]KAF7426347.1 hypothetical protein PC9H_008715 [Pleurotus ostreatus]